MLTARGSLVFRRSASHRSLLVPVKSLERPGLAQVLRMLVVWKLDGKLEGTAFYVDRLSSIATMQVIPTFP
jgi:hypothetical protein